MGTAPHCSPLTLLHVQSCHAHITVVRALSYLAYAMYWASVCMGVFFAPVARYGIVSFISEVTGGISCLVFGSAGVGLAHG